jgi:hypothetical protein
VHKALSGASIRSAGAALVLDGAWRRLGLDQIIGKPMLGRRHPDERAAFAIVAYCALAGRSTASVAEWVDQDISISGTDNIAQPRWEHAANLLGDGGTREQAQECVLARADSGPIYLLMDSSAAGGEVALAISRDGLPVRLVPRAGGRHSSGPAANSGTSADSGPAAGSGMPLAQERPTEVVVVIQPGEAAAPVPSDLQHIQPPGHGRVSYQRVSEDEPAGTRLIFVRSRDLSRPWRQASRTIEVSAGPADDEVVRGYLDCVRARRDFADLLGRPPRPPFTSAEGADPRWRAICWIALLLTRQVEKDTKQPWPEVRTELERVQDIMVNVQPTSLVLRRRTPLSRRQRTLLDCYPDS